MISESGARRYITALLGVASESGAADVLAPLLAGLQELFDASDDLRQVLGNPRLPDDKKLAVLLQLLGGESPELMQRFLALLLRKRRIDVLRYAGTIYQQLLDEAAGVRHARVVTALPLSAEQEQRIAAMLSRQLDCQITLESAVDPAVIGGLAVQVGDLLIDGTIRRRLQDLRARVSGARA